MARGRYVEIDPQSPGRTTRALDEHGWSGTVALNAPDAAQALQSWTGDLHLVAIAGSDATDEVIAALESAPTRPWVIVAPPEHTDRLVAARYRPALFDGISRFFHAEEHAELATALGYPACALDAAVDAAAAELAATNAELLEQLTRWRGRAVSAWAAWDPPRISDWSVDDQRELDRLRLEIRATHQTLSWRITRPIRAIRRITGSS